MGFLLRAVAILLAFSFIVYVFKAIARLRFHLRGTIRDVQKIREQLGGRPVPSAEMLRCAACGAFVSARDAVRLSSRNQTRVFCSQECVRAPIPN